MKAILFLFFVISIPCSSQDNKAIFNPCENFIKLDSLTSFQIFQTPTTFKIKKRSNLFVHIYLETCNGRLVFEERDSVSALLMKGEYISCDNFTEEEYIYLDIDTFKDKVGVRKMCLPKKNGEWRYWTREGELYKIEKYNDGVLIERQAIYNEED